MRFARTFRATFVLLALGPSGAGWAQSQPASSVVGPVLPLCSDAGIAKPVMQTKMSLQESYPPLSVILSEEGNTTVAFTVKKNGTVADVRVQSSSGYLRLDDASVTAMRQMLFTPPKRGNEAIDCSLRFRIIWKLTGDTDVAQVTQGDSRIFKPPFSWYPAQARTDHREGLAVIAVEIGADGKLMKSAVAKSSGSSDLDNASLEYVKTLQFSTISTNGRPIISGAVLFVVWTLKESDGTDPSKVKP